MEPSVRCIEYNLINNIPILLPKTTPFNFNYCPRHTIADAEKILHCFDKNMRATRVYDDTFQYVKIEMNKVYDICGRAVAALYYYVIIERTELFDIDINDVGQILRWVNDNSDHHYIIVTTPMLEYNNTRYAISNDTNIAIRIFEDIHLKSDESTIQKLIKDNCYTICDNFNVGIALYQKRYINKKAFMEFTKILNVITNHTFTNSIWFHIMNQHRLLNACDFPCGFLYDVPHLIDRDILGLYGKNIFDADYVYMQTIYNKEVLVTTSLSGCYPCLNVFLVDSILLFDIWGKKRNQKYIKDLYGLFASFIRVKSMWKFWCVNKKKLLEDLIESYDKNIEHVLYDMLVNLFVLYNIGFNGIKIKRSRVQTLWRDVLEATGNTICNIIGHLSETTENLEIPYTFLMHIHHFYDIDYSTKSMKLVKYNDNFIYQFTSLYAIFTRRKNTIYYFTKNVIDRRMLEIVLCIYKKFDMFEGMQTTSKHIVGDILIDYIKNNTIY